jgi:hypothetical protein
VKPLELEDLQDLVAYEKARPEFLTHLIELKQPRRIAVGPELTFVFENRDTIRFQVQEMMRTERIVKDEQIQHELDVYNELMPGEHELSATLMIEITDPARIKPTLDRLAGIDEHVFLEIGNDRAPALFDPRQFEEERIAAVQYLRFALGPALAASFRDENVAVTLCVALPAYSHRAPLSPGSRASLAADLIG